MLVGLCRWIHPASGHRCVLGLVKFAILCKSMSFCPSCPQCPQCCRRTYCRGTLTTVLAYLARNGCESSSGFSPEGWLFPPLQPKAHLDKGSLGSQWPFSGRSLKESLLDLIDLPFGLAQLPSSLQRWSKK